jgi:hypothetical protein
MKPASGQRRRGAASMRIRVESGHTLVHCVRPM